ncbi:extracellular solute-binding protein [Nostoc sp. FACHB-152]|uniref:extracellular solute-binding protein n=1 Tax=unclassified Nostoc TaxID=2593658 RepID=UPI0016866A18|nr:MULTISPECIES: extracellular solute-binding protein [unclassified Nostoc]MBD2450343.1 extracellular solute-binding protein [Nostoc sp. FACHB-152]MBD2471753.1 extracellular solute-binding protein [Nostoc sp. FACHB-145]
MDRRSFLLSISGLAFSQLLVGCGNNKQTKFNVQLLKGSIPSQVVDKFRQGLQQQAQLKFAPVDQLQNLYKQLQNWQEPPKTTNKQAWTNWTKWIPFINPQTKAVVDLVTLGDYWLKAAIEQKLIQPLEEAEVKQLKSWSTLDEKWRQLVTRNDQGYVAPQGKVWAAPYRWGSTVIVYNRDKFKELGWMPQDWSDLWREGLRSRISLLDNPREVIGLVLKKLGKSYNIENLDTVPNLEKELQTLNQQVKLYSSNTYLEPLIIGDTWLAVGWSSDILPLLARYPHLGIVVPQSGTAIWADLWVRPTKANKSDISSKWIDFCWQPEIAKQITLQTRTNSPIFPEISAADLQEPIRSLLQANRQVFHKSEFLLALPTSTAKQYESLFTKIKTS